MYPRNLPLPHTHSTTIVLSHIKYAISIDTQTMWPWIIQTTSFNVDDSQQLTLGGELLNSVVVTVSYVDHTTSINSYTTWSVKLSWLSSFATEAVRVGEVSIEDLDMMVTLLGNKNVSIVMNSNINFIGYLNCSG